MMNGRGCGSGAVFQDGVGAIDFGARYRDALIAAAAAVGAYRVTPPAAREGRAGARLARADVPGIRR